MHEIIKKINMAKKYVCNSFNTNKENYDAYLELQTISAELSEMVLKRKESFYRLLSKINLIILMQCQIILAYTENYLK